MARFANPNERAVDYSTWQLVRDVWEFLKTHRLRFFAVSVLRLSSDLVGLYPIYAFASFVTLLSGNNPGENIPKITRILTLVITAITWQLIAVYISRAVSNSIIEKVSLDAEVRTIRHLFTIDIAWHEKENSGNKLKRISNGVGGIAKMLHVWMGSIIGIVVNFVGTLVIIAKFNVFTSFVILFFIVSYYILSYLLGKSAAAAVQEVNIQSEKVNGLETQALSNIRTVKVMGMANSLHAIISQYADTLYVLLKKRIYRFQNRLTLLALWSNVIRMGTLVYIIFEIAHGKYAVGFLVLFNGYFSMVRDLATNLSDISQEIIIARYSVSRFKATLNEPITIDDDSGKDLFPTAWDTISLKGVAFGYENNEVLKDLSFTIKRGEKVGIVGLSGAGKSTLFKLLLKEYENFTGDILVNNQPIQHIQKSDYFKHVAVVLQDTEVFNFSLKENVTLGNSDQKENTELLERALEIAHVTDFLPKLPEGVDSLIGEKGIKLSGGEKQRLGIARAVFKEPQILLLDEATSHLDIESEAKIKDSLHTFFESVTAIVIAHRLTTIKEMDKILVIEEGKLVEEGSFEELMTKHGRFSELWEKQKL